MGQLALLETEPDNNVAFTFSGVLVRRNDERMINLTEMWRAAGSPSEKNPNDWRSLPEARKFINHIGLRYNTGKSGIIRAERGRGKSTWAHWQIAVAYAKYLSPDFHAYVNEAFKEWAEEKNDPGLKIERGIEGFRKRGYSSEWIAARLDGITARKALMSTLGDHNCKTVGKDNPFAEATRAITIAVVGQSPREIKQAKGLAKSASTRDSLDELELAGLRYAEIAARHLIQKERAIGNKECVERCERAGKAVRNTLAQLQAS